MHRYRLRFCNFDLYFEDYHLHKKHVVDPDNWIRIQGFDQSCRSAFILFIQIRIQHFRLNTDPDPGLLWPKLKKKLQLKIYLFLDKKTTIYLSLGIHKERPSHRSLQLSKENIQHFKTWNFLYFFSTFVGHFCPPGSGSNWDPEPWFWWSKTEQKQLKFFYYLSWIIFFQNTYPRPP